MLRALIVASLFAGACSANDDVPAPQLSSIVPSSGPAGTIVVVEGQFFCQRPDTGNEDPMCDSTGEVNFGASPGTISEWMDTAIMVEVPQGAHGSVEVSVAVDGRTSNSVTFTVN